MICLVHVDIITFNIFSQILKDATLFFLRGTPNLATVLPAMDHIDNVFTNGMLPSSKNNIAIRVAIEVAKKTLNRYYSLTDFSELYRIAIGLFTSYSYPLIW